MEMLSSTSPPERTRYSPIPPSHHQLTLPDPSQQGLHSTPDSPAKPEKNGHARDHSRIAKFFEIQTLPNGKTRTSLKSLSRRKLSQQKEKKATQMLAIVLGEYCGLQCKPCFLKFSSLLELAMARPVTAG